MDIVLETRKTRREGRRARRAHAKTKTLLEPRLIFQNAKRAFMRLTTQAQQRDTVITLPFRLQLLAALETYIVQGANLQELSIDRQPKAPCTANSQGAHVLWLRQTLTQRRLRMLRYRLHTLRQVILRHFGAQGFPRDALSPLSCDTEMFEMLQSMVLETRKTLEHLARSR